MADTAEHSDSEESELSFSYKWSDEDEEELIRKAVAAEENVIQPYRHEPVTQSPSLRSRTLSALELQVVQPWDSQTIQTIQDSTCWIDKLRPGQ